MCALLPCQGPGPQVIDKQGVPAVLHVGEEGDNLCEQTKILQDPFLVCGSSGSVHGNGGEVRCGGWGDGRSDDGRVCGF